MSRILTTDKLLERSYDTFKFKGVFEQVFGNPEKGGIWLIYGREKQGKTWGTLLIVKRLIEMKERVLYVSAEEGFKKTFTDTVKRAQMPTSTKMIQYLEYEPIEELKQRLRKRNAPKIVVLDNMTRYGRELRGNASKELSDEFPNVTFICIAHEKRGVPFPSSAEMVQIYADIIIQVIGLQLQVSARCPGGILNIDEKKAQLFHGVAQDIN